MSVSVKIMIDNGAIVDTRHMEFHGNGTHVARYMTPAGGTVLIEVKEHTQAQETAVIDTVTKKD